MGLLQALFVPHWKFWKEGSLNTVPSHMRFEANTASWSKFSFVRPCLRVEFLLKTDSGYPKDAEVTLFTLANPESSFRFNTHWSAPPGSALARSGGPGARQAEGL